MTRVLVWLAGPVAIAALNVAVDGESAFVRMIVLVVGLSFWMKAVVTAEAAARGERLPVGRWLVFVFLWPGMRQRPFLRAEPRVGAGRMAVAGLLRIAFGAALVAAAHAVRERPWLATVPALIGLSFALHFGLCRISTALMRALGFDVREPFRDPQRSRTLGEFWARRWNIPFSEMVQDTVYRHLRHPMAGFVFSAALHEVALSLPVRAGYGLPSAYFLLQGLLVLVERRFGIKSRLWTAAWILVPVPLVFHPPFLRGVVWPIVGIV